MPVLVLDHQYLLQRVTPQQASPTKIMFLMFSLAWISSNLTYLALKR